MKKRLNTETLLAFCVAAFVFITIGGILTEWININAWPIIMLWGYFVTRIAISTFKLAYVQLDKREIAADEDAIDV